MATGTVSSIVGEGWQLISTITPTSGTSASLATGIAGYKKLLVVWDRVMMSSSSGINFTLNGSTSGYFGGSYTNEYNGQLIGSYTDIRTHGNITATDYIHGYFYINNVLESVPKTINGMSDVTGYVITVDSCWNNTDAVTSITVRSNNSATLTGGTIKLYGIAA